ncbi:MAG TPA: SMC family ATPase [Longimicrobiaceae bacterium]|nr:SMC family ATPase [Longimicrobiaceae bacterium]
MRILELHLQNFRQHVDTHIRLQPGLTGIIGPNGAGKSTLLEAIAWAIYGAEAARGTNETIRFARAGARSRVEVELRFELGGHEYRVVRTLNGADAYLDGGATPVASTLGGVTRYLQGRLGMNRREFFNTYFTGQKELQFLAAMGSAERGRFLSTVLGYEKLRDAQELARQRRNELRREIDALRAGLGDAAEIRAQRQAAEAAIEEARTALSAAELERATAAEALARLAPRWAEGQAERERDRELAHVVEAAERDRTSARRELERAEAELARIAAAEGELFELRAQLEPLPTLSEECARLSELARLNERRRAVAEQVAEIDAELERSRARLERLEQAPDLVKRYSAELDGLREEQRRVASDLEEKKTSWLRDRQDAETKLQGYRERGSELLEQVRQIRDAGPEGKCPTCERPLGADFPRVLGELEEQWGEVVGDGKWWKSRREQLEEKPAEVAAGEARLAELEQQIAEKARKHTRCEAAAQELEQLRADRGQREKRRESLRQELETIPAGYDREQHRAAEARLQALRGLETRAARLEETTGRRAEREKEVAEIRLRDAAAAARGAEAVEARRGLAFSESAFDELRREYEAAGERGRLGELRLIEQRGRVATAEQAALSARREEEQHAERAREIELREVELRHHNELDAALTELRGELNTQVRPELSEIASLFLAQLTDGRYTALEIDEGYNILVLDEGEEKPVISGGEEDVANLVLRLSLSQMIAERAGPPLSLLVLDEVFGSLDVARRDNVVQLLRRLEDRFDQVILITHIEGIRESLDQVLRVSFDERTGTSVVREESFVGSDDAVPEGAAAD